MADSGREDQEARPSHGARITDSRGRPAMRKQYFFLPSSRGLLAWDVDRLVLWDPVVTGRRYLEELGAPAGLTSTVGVLGFPLSPALAGELGGLDLLERDHASARSIERFFGGLA